MNDFTEKQLKDIAFFNKQLSVFLADELLKHKYVIIAYEKIQRYFDTIELAVDFAIENYPVGEYIIQQIINEG